MNTNGAFAYKEILNMELSEFKDVALEVAIRNSSERAEQTRIDNHANAVRGR